MLYVSRRAYFPDAIADNPCSAKILGRIILADPRLRSYSDIGRKAFGPKATLLISLLFCLELFSVAVILVTLYADSLHSIIPEMSSNAYKVWGLLMYVHHCSVSQS